jgi:inner membrane protein
MPLLFWLSALALSILPDADVFAFNFGIPYAHPFGHRGFSHSLAFALTVSFGLTLLTFRKFAALQWWSLWAFFFLAMASHGILDAFTNGGLGIAFFAPFDDTRYFFPWRPILVPPIGIKPFLSVWGLQVCLSELSWVWFPMALAVSTVEVLRLIKRARAKAPQPTEGQA